MPTDIEQLQQLTAQTLEELKHMPQPVVRVCGPLTTGPLGYEKNFERLTRSEEILKQKGMTVFEFGPAEKIIKEKGIDVSLIVDYFHVPVLQSGLITTAYFLPDWDKSNGATTEREFIKNNTSMEIKEFPEEWF